MPFVNAVYDKIVSNGPIVKSLGAWDFGTGAKTPAVFTISRIPGEAPYPLIMIEQSEGQGNFALSDRTKISGTATITIEVMGNKEESTKALRALAHDVFDLFCGKDVEVSGWCAMNARATLPGYFEDETGFPGYRISVEIDAYKNTN